MENSDSEKNILTEGEGRKKHIFLSLKSVLFIIVFVIVTLIILLYLNGQGLYTEGSIDLK